MIKTTPNKVLAEAAAGCLPTCLACCCCFCQGNTVNSCQPQTLQSSILSCLRNSARLGLEPSYPAEEVSNFWASLSTVKYFSQPKRRLSSDLSILHLSLDLGRSTWEVLTAGSWLILLIKRIVQEFLSLVLPGMLDFTYAEECGIIWWTGKVCLCMASLI